MEKNMDQMRQGDVFVERIDGIPGDATPHKREGGRWIAAHGEVTGHAHAIADRKGLKMFTRGEGNDEVLYLANPTDTEMTHEEHATMPIPAGTHRVRRQREYAPDKNRFVAD